VVMLHRGVLPVESKDVLSFERFRDFGWLVAYRPTSPCGRSELSWVSSSTWFR